MTPEILPLGAKLALYLVFAEFWIAVLAVVFSTIHSLITQKNLKSILTITGLALVVAPCFALGFFPKNNNLLAACLIIACSLIVIAIIGILFSAILNLLKK